MLRTTVVSLALLGWLPLATSKPAAAQSLEDRVRLLEQQVAELRRLQGLPEDIRTSIELPAELVGNTHVRWGYPGGSCMLLVKEYYVVCHDNPQRMPEWVTYRLTRDDLGAERPRTDDFRPDPALPSGERAALADYRNSGYDRGHMAPAADFKRNAVAMSETFLLTNMTPQRPNLNRRIWAQLEEEIRSLVLAHGSIWVFTGSLFLDANGNPTAPTTFIGPGRVAVPTHFYKAVLCEHATGSVEMFAFIMENRAQPLTGRPRDYLVAVDRVEALAGIDLFAALPDALENSVEATVVTNWPIQ